MYPDPDEDFAGKEAVERLCAAIQQVYHFEKYHEGLSVPGRDIGDYMLADALFYASYGDAQNGRAFLNMYEEWKETGFAPWPYVNPEDDPGSNRLVLGFVLSGEDHAALKALAARIRDQEGIDEETPFGPHALCRRHLEAALIELITQARASGV